MEGNETENVAGNTSATGTGSLLEGMLDNTTPNLDEQNQEPNQLKEDANAKTLGGFAFNQSGDLIDKDGKVLKSKADLGSNETPATPETNEEGEENNGAPDLYLNQETGNLEDVYGQVIIKKEDVKKDDKGMVVIPKDLEIPEPPLVVELVHKYGVTPVDEKGNKKVYTDDLQGITEYIEDVNQLALQERLTKFFESNPEVKKFHQHLSTGKKAEDYFKPTAKWGEVDLSKADDGTKYDVVFDSLIRRGISKDEAKTIADMYKTGGTLGEQASKAQDLHKQLDKQEDDAREKAYNAKLQAYEENQNKYWKSVEETVKSGKLSIKDAADNSTIKSIAIPQVEREQFFDYLAVMVDENGRSQEMLDRSGESTETKLALAYLRWKKFDLSSIVKIAAGEQRVAQLRQRLKPKNTDGGNRAATKDGNALDIDINKLF